jgi:hypothetical protein
MICNLRGIAIALEEKVSQYRNISFHITLSPYQLLLKTFLYTDIYFILNAHFDFIYFIEQPQNLGFLCDNGTVIAQSV